MFRGGWWAALLLAAGGCGPAVGERLRVQCSDGVYLFQRGDYRHARDTFQTALELAPEDPNIHYNLAQCWEQLGDADKAENLYRECLQKDPEHVDARHGLGVLLVRLGRREEAVKLSEEWLARQPQSADAYALDGWLWRQAGDLPRAQTRLQQALQFDARHRVALVELASVYEELRRPDRALILYEQALDSNPDQPDVIKKVNRLRSEGVPLPRPG